MADSNSFVFGTLSASSASFSSGTFDVKAKLRPRNRLMVAKGGRNRSSFRANTESSATNSNLSNSTLTTPFSNPFPSSHPLYITSTSGAGETTNFPAPISSGLQSSNAMNSTVFVHVFASSFVTHDKKVMPLSSDHAENSWKDAQPNQHTIQKEIETVPKMEETSESVSSPRLPLIPISRILKGIPHSPHFLQIRSYSEVARKSLMAGWDRAFEETVEEIHTLTANDFWFRSSKLWKTMEELQSLGYNVFRPRKRLVELTEWN
ncbi:hypothetical protein I3843_01G288300 [Carya illinoinensis]|uniref:Uncharacterized protein n=1 Tax=Carya illinoinensis TaxID=32201 RepID=A0A922GBM1_CARIL|nr:uncharacterized protein LOC122291949 [Carya illinoinensis]KAG6735010.1 hypothetical protein I3842_01G298800 [Carya illinoinensis]KAG7999076.1 hypothetical protein I3843_01G288300 [Carya illinoinensis]